MELVASPKKTPIPETTQSNLSAMMNNIDYLETEIPNSVSSISNNKLPDPAIEDLQRKVLELERRLEEKHKSPMREKTPVPEIKKADPDERPIKPADPDERPLKPAQHIDIMKSPVDVTFNLKMAIEKSAERISILKQASPRINSPPVI